MGLGKSLTILSAILGTLDYARSSGRPECSSIGVGGTFRSKSTLIIVPSTCRLDLKNAIRLANANISTLGWMGGRDLQVRLFKVATTSLRYLTF